MKKYLYGIYFISVFSFWKATMRYTNLWPVIFTPLWPVMLDVSKTPDLLDFFRPVHTNAAHTNVDEGAVSLVSSFIIWNCVKFFQDMSYII